MCCKHRFTSPGLGYLLYLLDKRCGDCRDDQETASPPVWHQPQPGPHAYQDHAINIVVEGVARFTWWSGAGEQHTTKVSSGQTLVIPGGTPHIVEVLHHALVRGVWIHPERIVPLLPGATAHRQLLKRLASWHKPLPPLLSQEGSLFAQMQELCDQTQRELKCPDIWQKQAVELLANMAVLCFVRLMLGRGALANSSAQERVEQVRDWMERHYLERPPLNQLCRRAGLSPSRFSQLFRQDTGLSPGAFVLRCRLDFAADLLLTSDLPISQIAGMAGFEHFGNFTRLFKEHQGQTPSRFRCPQASVAREAS